MKILLLTNILSPYRKKFYDELYAEFNNRNIDFNVWVMADTEPARNWSYNQFKTDYTKLLSNRTIKHNKYFVHFNNNYSSLLKEYKPDIVIASGSYTFPSVWTTIKMKHKLNYELFFWSESHLNETRSLSRQVLKIREILRKKIYKKFDGFWYAGKLSRKFVEKYAKPTSKYIFVPNLINQDLFYQANELRNQKKELRKKWKIPENDFVFILPARLTEVKGIIPFLELFSKSKYKKNVTILIPGDGELKSKIIKKSEELKIDTILLGYQEENKIVELYAISDSLLLPSLSDPNPLTCIEAIWAGLPLFVSEHVGNHPEIVKNNENGYVFSYDNKKSAIKLIDKLICSDKKWRDDAHITSLNIARSMYNINTVIKKIVDSTLNE